MKLFDEFATWFKEKDQQLMELHTVKEADMLSKAYKGLEEEQALMREYLRRIENLIEDAENFVRAEAINPADVTQRVSDFEKWFNEVEIQLTMLFSKRPVSLSEEEKLNLARELGRLTAEKERLEKRIHKFYEIMAKTRLLIDDLNEDLAKKLTGGHSLAAIGEILLKKFSREYRAEYGLGRKEIRQFLQDYYQIDKQASRELFILLEKAGILRFSTRLPDDYKTQPLVYYSPDIDDLMGEYTGISPQIFGAWEINA